MVVATAAASFFPVVSSASSSNTNNNCSKFCTTSPSLGFKTKQASGSLKLKANSQAPVRVNGSSVNILKDEVKHEEEVTSSSPRTFINQLPDWSMLLAAITTVFLAAEKQWMMLDWKPKRPDTLIDPFGFGKIVQDGLVFRQNFSIRSYEIGADRTASIETLMNHLQETALNHVKTAGLLGNGFGSTPEMCKKNLIWVVARMHVLVDRYPTWGDVIRVDTWVSASGKNGMRRDWVLSDYHTGETLTRASSVWVLMNKSTRKISKMPSEVRGEISPFFNDVNPVVEEDGQKIKKIDEKTADFVRTGLTPKWSDLDVNQHVNNVKYINWILESGPQGMLESEEMWGMTLEYRRECGRESVLRSLATVSEKEGGTGKFECHHLLRLEDGGDIVKGRTMWRPKRQLRPLPFLVGDKP